MNFHLEHHLLMTVPLYNLPRMHRLLKERGALDGHEAELVSVLAHEISHVALSHSGSFETKSSWVDFIAGIMGAGSNVITAGMQQVTDELEKRMLENGRQKEFEFEADSAGALYAAAVGYDPAGGLRYLRRMQASDKNDTLVATHPTAADRIAALEKFIQEQGFERKLRNPERFTKYKNILAEEQSAP